jgi:hypothetical protein
MVRDVLRDFKLVAVLQVDCREIPSSRGTGWFLVLRAIIDSDRERLGDKAGSTGRKSRFGTFGGAKVWLGDKVSMCAHQVTNKPVSRPPPSTMSCFECDPLAEEGMIIDGKNPNGSGISAHGFPSLCGIA